jgi:hypothetical protein
VSAALVAETQEYQCQTCDGNFVEALGQDVEAFLEPEEEEPPAVAAGSGGGGGMGRGEDVRNAHHSLLQRISGTAGRPLGLLLYSGMLPELQSGNNGLDDLIHHLMMTETSHRSFGAMQAAIDSLERVHITEDTDIQALGPCGISMEDLEIGNVAVRLPCGHIYTEDLIIKWLKSHHTCPTCRHELPQEGSS